jgi:hypothetical protein
VFGGRWPTGPSDHSTINHRWNRREQREPAIGDFFQKPKDPRYVDPQLQNHVSLITAMPFSKTD